MTIARKILLYFVVLTALLVSLGSVLWLMYRNADDLAGRQDKRFASFQLAEQLQHSSDDLTRMARSYVNTGDSKYKQYFETILAIRDGLEPRPRNYDYSYWDMVTGDPSFKPEPGERVALLELLRRVGLSPEEFEILSQGKKLSDHLTDLENQAFQAMEGVFQDSRGLYTIKGKPDPELAHRLLYGRDYHQSKAGIMAKINQFKTHLETRTKAEVRAKEKRQQTLTVSAIVLAILLFATSLFGYGYFKKAIITPLAVIEQWIGQVEKHQYDLSPAPQRRDEIGRIASSFAFMAQKVAAHMDLLRQSSLTDPLTGLNNRAGLNQQLALLKYNHERYGAPCSVVMFDVDGFKQVNDRHGHLAGDALLCELARIMQSKLRRSDILGRWGGDEFLILCPNTALEGGRMVAEYLRMAIADHIFSGGVGPRSASFGVSALEGGLSVDEVIRRADNALYQAKQKGGNRVC